MQLILAHFAPVVALSSLSALDGLLTDRSPTSLIFRTHARAGRR